MVDAYFTLVVNKIRTAGDQPYGKQRTILKQFREPVKALLTAVGLDENGDPVTTQE